MSTKYFYDGRVREGVRYSMILEDVQKSEAYHSLPDYARSVLVALSSKFRGTNNGDLSLTASSARELGISAEWKLRAGLAMLEEVGLIETTRRGGLAKGKGTCNLYALTCYQVAPSDKYDVPCAITRPPSHLWVHWRKPANWKAKMDLFRIAAQGKRNRGPKSFARFASVAESSHPTQQAQAATLGGSKEASDRPTRVG